MKTHGTSIFDKLTKHIREYTMHGMKYGFAACTLFLFIFSGCTRPSTYSVRPFEEVKLEIEQRAGKTITRSSVTDISTHLKNDLSLEEVLNIFILNNNELKATYHKLGVAYADILQASLYKNPIADLSFRFDGGSLIEMGIVQNFLDILLKPLKKKMAFREFQLTKNHVVQEILQLIFEVKRAFYIYQSAEINWIVQQEIIQAKEAACDAARRLYEAGNITKLAQIHYDLTYEQALADLLMYEIRCTESKENLSSLMGLQKSATPWSVTLHQREFPNSILSEDEILNVAFENNLSLLKIKNQIKMIQTKSRLSSAEATFPDLGAGLDSEKEPEGNWFVGPQFALAIPFFDFGQAAQAKGSAQISVLYHQFLAHQVNIRSSVLKNRKTVNTLCKRLKKYKENLIPLSEEVTTETMLQLNAMQLGVFEALIAKQQELEIKIEASNSYREFWIAYSQLESIMAGVED